MTYSPLKPDGGPSPNIDVAQIQVNFSQFSTIFQRNHTALNNANQGDHEAVIFEEQSVDPVVDDEFVSLYAKEVVGFALTQPQIFARIQEFLPTDNDQMAAPNDPMQMTFYNVNTAGPIYQSFVMGGYLVFFGQTTDVTANIVLSPGTTSIVCAIAASHTMTSVGTPIPYRVSTNVLSHNTFKINIFPTTMPYLVSWMVIAIQ